MGVFEDLHRDRIVGSLAMYDRMIFKGRLSALYKENGAKCFLWTQGVALKDFTPYAKWTTARIADNARGLAQAAGRPVISFDHVKTRNSASARTSWPVHRGRGRHDRGGHLCDQRGGVVRELPRCARASRPRPSRCTAGSGSACTTTCI